MPWKVTEPMSQRLLFIAEWLQHEESIAELCRQYGISRKTAYKWIRRVEQEGEAGLNERSRVPHHCPHRLDPRKEHEILKLREKHPTWGARKLRHVLMRDRPDQTWPVASTIGCLLQRKGLSVPRRQRRRATPTASQNLTKSNGANDIWTADFQGEFVMANGKRCKPLTIVDDHSRFILRCVGMSGHTGWRSVAPLFEAAFREYGLPNVIRTDNGPPFASTGLGGLTRLSVWWIKLGIMPERIQPGHPEQNGRHERMHRTLKAETAQPPAPNLAAQQRRFLEFMEIFNFERPHEGIEMNTPAQTYTPSPRCYPRPLVQPEDYPHGWMLRKVKDSGRIKWGGVSIHLTDALTGEYVGLAPSEDDGWWDIYYGPLLVAHFDETSSKIVAVED